MNYGKNELVKMDASLSAVVSKAIPALSGELLTYNAEKNIYLTPGYTSAAGNTYFRAIRFSELFEIQFNIGIGYCHTFLNGITLYVRNGQKYDIITQRQWGGSDNYMIFNEYSAKEECVYMLRDFLAGQAKMIGTYVPDQKLQDFSRQLIDGAYQKRIAG